MNLKTAARRLGVHYQTAYRWVRSGQLVAVKVGSGYEISEAALTRFQVQRAAVERIPDFEVPVAPPAHMSPADALTLLDSVVAHVTIDARPVLERAARIVADVLGDVAVVYTTGEIGCIEVPAVAHRDPVCEVKAATVARHGDPESSFARAALASGVSIFIPQVPQRAVREGVRPEMQQYLADAGCFSAMSVPVAVDGGVRAALVTSRDTPARPFTRDDLQFVEAVAERLGDAFVMAAACRESWALRDRVVAHLRDGEVQVDGDDVLARFSDEPVALLDLDLRHLAATEKYAAQLGTTRAQVMGGPLAPMAMEADALRDALARVLFGEIDYCQVAITPLGDPASRTMVQAAMVREADATPRCVVVVTHELSTRHTA